MELQLLGETFSLEKAKALVEEYAFNEESSRFLPATGPAYGSKPDPRPRPRWAYRVYDCVPASPGKELTLNDVLLISGINGDLNQKRVASALAVLPAVNESLVEISPDLTFWDLKREEIWPAGEPTEGSDAWLMHRAWWLFMGVSDIDVTITHKVLHHKRPGLFPLVDRATVDRLGRGKAWVTIYDDLLATPYAWSELEDWFEGRAKEEDGLRLTRLRLHDILLWRFLRG